MNITSEQLLQSVKNALNITGDYHDSSLTVYINEVKRYLASVDVPTAVLCTDAVEGIVALGVDSLRETGALSAYFKERAIQLRLTPSEAATAELTDLKLEKVCGITENASYSYDPSFINSDDVGVFKYGDRYFIKFASFMQAGRDIPANTQIQVAKIDDQKYWPITDLYMTGYCTIGSNIMPGMFRIWSYGAISVVTPDVIPNGSEFMPELSSEYMGVR